MNFKKNLYILIVLLLFIFSGDAARAQEPKPDGAVGFLTTEFTYQGKLTEGSAPASGIYDFEFRLTDTNGNVLGTIQRTSVPVKNGIFTVRLDFGFAPFNTLDNKFLEIGVRKLASGQFETLAPRQPVTATPISIMSSQALNANFAGFSADSQKLGGVAASGYVSTSDPRLSDARMPVPGSGDYIQNTTTPQPANFSVTGSGTVGAELSAKWIDATVWYSLRGSRILGVGATSNLFAGLGAGAVVTTGDFNSFFGKNAGLATSEGRYNSAFGASAGAALTTGGGNSFFGSDSGVKTTTPSFNSFFGLQSGYNNITGSHNSYFGAYSGRLGSDVTDNSFFGAYSGNNNGGSNNSFFGSSAGFNNGGSGNSFFGADAGESNTSGLFNSFFGTNSGNRNTVGQFNAFYGANSGFSNTEGSSNTFLGSEAGIGNTTGSENVFLGSGAGASNTTGSSNIFIGKSAGAGAVSGTNNIVIGNGTSLGANVSNSVVIGNSSFANLSNQIILGSNQQNTFVIGKLIVSMVGAAGGTQLCRNVSNEIANCSSSIRYKKDIENFTPGLDLIKKLRPVSFTWKTGGMRDLGFVAEEVAAVEPLLATHNEQGETEGVKYDRISAALVNAAKEQQTQLESQQTQIENQQTQLESQARQLRLQQEQIEALKKLVCSQNTQAQVCREKEPQK